MCERRGIVYSVNTAAYCKIVHITNHALKVPKREIFVTELFTRSDPIWIGDMRTEPIKPFV